MILINSCAAIQAPPGGPKDETPPELIETTPANGTVLFSGGRVELIFSEYVDESSVEKAIRVLPTLPSPPDIIYKGRRVFVELPDSLAENQTYIISIDRSFKDEHNVQIAQGTQVAYATGHKIDIGNINGKIYYENPSTIHLWKFQHNETDSSIFTRKPDYFVDAADDGTFSFNYLSNGTYRLIGVDQSAAGLILSPRRMNYGVPSVNTIQLTAENNSINNLKMRVPESRQGIEMESIDWNQSNWGTIVFSKSISEILPQIQIEATAEDSSEIAINTFINPLDDTQLHFRLLTDSLNTHYFIESNKITDGIYKILNQGQIKVNVDTTRDTTFLKIESPKNNEELLIDEDETRFLTITFNRLMKQDSIQTFLTLKQDSTQIDYTAQWVSPLSLELAPEENWRPKSTYNIEIIRDGIHPEFGRSLEDSITTFALKTSGYQGYGNLLGSINKFDEQKWVVELISMEKEPKTSRTVVNSNGTFNMNRILEGNYTLLLFQDTDGNNRYSHGQVEPLNPSEWFFYYSDTVKIRANWDLELSQINMEQHP